MSSNLAERSQSRGREPVYSSGRGGAGNMRPASSSRGPAARQPGPDDYSPARGRELADRRDEMTSTGRGGAGNLRSRSRDASAAVEDAIRLERQYTKEKEALQGEQVYSTGRGGAGNMSRSRSRSRGPSLQTVPSGLASTGRDGRPSVELNKLEEEDRKKVEQEASQHSGYANHASGSAPLREAQHIQHEVPEYLASGRGGAGNIHHATAAH